ncbi:MAG TPA: S9 family peptidase, partial [Thermoanaerobaculia bacterium]|nr:S9 family peptidase [Thermoanaerobaculia bacterium]
MPIRSFRAAVLTALLLAGAVSVSQAAPFRFDELARAGRVSGFSLSPDGQWVAYAVGTPLVNENRTAYAIWLASTSASGAPARRLTTGDKRDTDPAFSPDGKGIAFLSNREGGSQIWLLDLAGGEPRKATSFPTEVNAFRWAPDGASFVIVSDVFPDCADVACLAQRVAAREKSVTKAHVSERLLFRHWDSWQNGLRTHLWKLGVTGGEAMDLTPGDIDAPPFAVGGGTDYEVSPDGRDFVYASNPDKVQATSTNGDIWIEPFAGGGRPADLTANNRAYDGTPHFSPDGKWIAYRAQKRPGFEADRFTLMLLDRATGRSRELTPTYYNWVNEFAWAPDSKSLYFVSEEQGHGVIYRVPVEGGL